MRKPPASRGSAGLRILHIADRVLTPDLDGASARDRAILQAFQRLGCRITFVAHHPDSFYAFARTVARDIASLEAAGIEVARPPETPSVEALLAERGRDFHLVLMSPYPIAHRYLPAVRRHAPAALAVYDAMDVGHVQHYRRAKATGNVPDLKRAIEAKRQELALARLADAVLVCSDEDREAFHRLCPGARLVVASHVVPPRPASMRLEGRSGLIFLGSFPHLANVDAMTYFVREVLPAARAALPELELTIVGLDPRGDLAPLVGPGVTLAGWVPDLDEVFARARVFVAPLRYGAGIKVKVLDSLARGVPVVATPLAAEGLHLCDGESALIAEGPEEFAAAVVHLHGDPPLWRRLVDGGHAVLDRHFSESAMDASLAPLLAGTLERREHDGAAR